MAGMRFVNKHLLPYIQYDNVIWLIREFSVLITLQEDFSQIQTDSLFTYNFAEISLLTFLSTTSTFVLEALFSGRLLGIPMGTNSAPKLAESLPSYLRVRFHGQNNETGYYKSHPVQKHLSVHQLFIQY